MRSLLFVLAVFSCVFLLGAGCPPQGDDPDVTPDDGTGGGSENATPVAEDLSLSADSAVAVSIALQASDADGDSLTFSIVSEPAHGTYTLTGDTVVYVSHTGFAGGDQFTFEASDGQAADQAVVTITVRAVEVPNHLPVAYGQEVLVRFETPKSFELGASDQDSGDVLTYEVLEQPTHGSVCCEAPALTYTPAAGYEGSDALTFRVWDGKAFSNEAQVNFVVSARPPTAVNLAISTLVDFDVAIVLQGSHPGGTSVNFEIQNSPQHGTLHIPMVRHGMPGIDSYVVYRPAGGFVGTDEFTYRCFTGAGGNYSDPAKVTITVAPRSACPEAFDLSFVSVPKRGKSFWINFAPLSFNPNAGVYPSELSIRTDLQQLFEMGYRGVLTFSAESTLAAIPRIAREIGFEYVGMGIWDPGNTAEVDEAVHQGNYVTFYVVGSEGMLRGEGNPYLRSELLSVLSQLRARTCKPVTTAESWAFWLQSGNADVLAAVDFVSANIYPWWEGIVEVQPAFDALNSHYQQLIGSLGKPVLVRETGWPAGEHPQATVQNQLQYFRLLFASEIPFVQFEAYDAFWRPESYNGYLIWWGRLNSSGDDKWEGVSLLDPLALDAFVLCPYAGTIELTLEGYDIQGDTLTFQVAGLPAHGTLSGSPPVLSYTPDSGFSGQDSFGFKVSDGVNTSDTGIVTIYVGTKPRTSPVAVSNSVTTPFQTAARIALVAHDPDGDRLFYEVLTGPVNGSLLGKGSDLMYQPNAGFTGADSFTFWATDGTLYSDPATISITVAAAGEPSIGFSFVPALGSFLNLRGTTTNVDTSQYSVVVFINVVGTWWVKPYLTDPLTAIQPDGTWVTDITTGGIDEQAGIIAAYVVPSDYSPHGPPSEGEYIASAVAYR